MVFLPGLNESYSVWYSAANSLAGTFNISPLLPGYNFTGYNPDDPFETNRGALGTLETGAVLVGHSAGGILARYKGQQQKLQAVVTYGSPNYGAPLAETYPTFCDFLGGTAFDFIALVNTLVHPDDDWVLDQLNPDFDFVGGEVSYFCFNFAVKQNIPGYPAGAELAPDAEFLATLNGSANVATEEANVSQEASVVVTADDWLDSGPFRALWGDGTGLARGHIVQDFGWAALAYEVSLELSYPDDPHMMDVENRLENLGDDILFIDDAWCDSVDGIIFGVCAANDEVVPAVSQALGRGITVPDEHGPEHLEEAQNSVTNLTTVFDGFSVPRK